jgi:tetratricopeptide (TPR) repeat protein
MSNKTNSGYMSALRVAAVAVFCVGSLLPPAWAQTVPIPDPNPKSPHTDMPWDNSPSGPQPQLPDTGPKAPKRPQLGKVIPEAPADRAKLLDDLYAHLATAPDEEASKPYAESIERLWLSSGSDTVAALMERAMQAVGQKRNDLALQLLSAVVEQAPDYAEGWNRRAYVFYTEGDYERSLGDLRRVLALDANHYKALDGLGQIMRQLDHKPQALQAYEKLQMVHPFWPNLANIIEELRREVDGRAL